MGSSSVTRVDLDSHPSPESLAATRVSAGGSPTLDSTAEEAEAGPRSIPPPGAVIDRVYQVLGPLGQGAMGVVLLAQDEVLHRKVALKLIRFELLRPGFRERFTQEARAMARVNHPNVLSIHAFGEHESVPYFAMEYVDGPTLEVWRRRLRVPPELDQVMRLLNEICLGVSAIHAAGTIHRDLKPSNILLDSELRPRVADLGVSVSYRADVATPNELVGTPAYMAPEVAFCEAGDGELTPQVDVYSLGCVAYELLTDELPFNAEEDVALMLQHATRDVPRPTSIRPSLPSAFDGVLLRALAKRPAERTATVDAFRRELLAAHAGSLEPSRLLVAEDDDDFRELLELRLRQDFPGADVECVADGRAALEALQRSPASVAIVDLQMPNLDGMALTALLRARPSCATMPIIVLTASGGPAQWKQLAALGADRFLVKPVNLDDVTTLIRKAVRERASAPPSARAGRDA